MVPSHMNYQHFIYILACFINYHSSTLHNSLLPGLVELCQNIYGRHYNCYHDYTVIVTRTRCSMREPRETALLHVACGNPARRRYCMGAKFSCISSSHAYSYIQQSGRT